MQRGDQSRKNSEDTLTTAHKTSPSIQLYLVGLILLVFLPLLVSEIYFFYDRYRYRKAAEFQSNLELARAVGRTFTVFIHDVLSQEMAIGEILTMRDDFTVDEMNRVLEDNKEVYPSIGQFGWLNPLGRVVASSLPEAVGIDVSHLVDIRKISRAGTDWSVSNLYLVNSTGRTQFNINRAVRDENGTLQGIVAAGVSIDRFDELFAFERSASGTVSIVDANGRLVYHHPAVEPSWEERNWLRYYPSLFVQALSGSEHVEAVKSPRVEKSMIAAVAPIRSIGWVAGAGSWEEEALGPILSDIVINVAAVLLVALASLAAAYFLSRRISASVGALRGQARDLGRGNLETRAEVSGPRELRELATVFNTMAENIAARDEERFRSILRVETALQARKHAEEALRESERKYRELVQNANSAIIRWNSDGIITFFNEYAQKFFGYTAKEVIGKKVNIIVPETESNGHDLSHLARDILEKPENYSGNVNENVCRDGRRVWMAWTNKPVFDAEGRVVEIFAVGTDVTDRKLSEDKVRRQNVILDAINRILGEALVCETEEEMGSLCLRAAEDLTESAYGFIGEIGADGLIHDIAISDPGWERCAMTDRTGHRAAFTGFKVHGLYGRVLRDGRSLFTNDPPSHPDSIGVPEGHPPLLSFLGVPLFHQGKTMGVLVVGNREGGYTEIQKQALEAVSSAVVQSLLRKRTELDRKRKEQELRDSEERLRGSLSEKEVLLKEIHHRVKNNMQVISSLVSLQAETVGESAMRDSLRDVTDRVRSMALVHEKLYQSEDLARIEFAGYMESLLDYLWQAHGTSASGIRLDLDLEPVYLSVNEAVPCGLILNELVSNALKHAFPLGGGGEVAVSLHSGREGRVTLQVRDNGAGLPAGYDWRQAGSLGMRLVQMLAGQLHAAVEVESNRGTSISLSFRG